MYERIKIPERICYGHDHSKLAWEKQVSSWDTFEIKARPQVKSTPPCSRFLFPHVWSLNFFCRVANLTQLQNAHIPTAPSSGGSRYNRYTADWSWCCRDAERGDWTGYEWKLYESRDIPAQSLWRNGIARWTSNPEAPGSSPGRDGSLCMPNGRPAVLFFHWRWWFSCVFFFVLISCVLCVWGYHQRCST